ncbi:MAG: malonyl CoA-acyl carrier protein transacylase [Erysipelotrichaceae bacterium]|nr:MAG: malonyl CoA-acyl carrier protein [Erysipelotrichaceae bacterium]TXT17946.1 MAG: malonyl CoA-acyl carrier protein transacylase [Erysipelotrichaceae bacterium]
MKIAFLFVGQGSQKVGMGKEVYDAYPQAKALLDSVEVDFDVKKIMFEGPEEVLNDTSYTQVCLVMTSLMIAKALEIEGIVATGTAGLSLGEYSALTYAKAINLNKVIPLVRLRGQIMAEALPIGFSSMSAVLSDKIDVILETLKENKTGIVEIANYNSPSQFVLSGEKEALSIVEKNLKEKGISRIIPLKVSGAFHSSLLKEASRSLKICLENAAFKSAEIPVYFNVSGEIEADVISALTLQIYNSVEWVKTIQNMIKDDYDTFIEIGPGKTLASLVRQIDPQVNVYSVESCASIEKLKGELKHE